MTRLGLFAVVAVAALASSAPAAASHAGAIADCGDAGTFTVRATANSAGFQSPLPSAVVLFEEGGALTVFELWVNGQQIWSAAETGREQNALDEVTCTFTIGAGATFRITGVLAQH